MLAKSVSSISDRPYYIAFFGINSPFVLKLASVKNSQSNQRNIEMKFQQKLVISIIGICSLLAVATSNSGKSDRDKKCGKSDCQKECEIEQKLDCGLISKLIKYLTELSSKKNCVRGCDVTPFDYNITIFPAGNYDTTTNPVAFASLNLGLNKNCCYGLSGIYYQTLSGIIPNGACVKLFNGANCTGTSITILPNISLDCSKNIDCAERLSQPGAVNWNDQTVAVQLC